MSTTRYTPGPWSVYELAPDSDHQQRHIITAQQDDVEVCGIVSNPADANVIAAAPDLLETLEAMVSMARNRGMLGKMIDDAEKAIARAKGGAA